MKQTYEKFLPRIKPRGKLLDLGCGSGRDTKAFSDLGMRSRYRCIRKNGGIGSQAYRIRGPINAL